MTLLGRIAFERHTNPWGLCRAERKVVDKEKRKEMTFLGTYYDADL